MKKKLLCLLMTLCLLVGSSMSVSAQQLFGDGESAEVPITYDNQSSFTINIPESLDLNNTEGYRFTADSMYITDSQMVCIYAPVDPIPMINEWGASGKMNLSTTVDGCVAKFYRGQTTSDDVMYGMFDGIEAGH